MNIRLTITAIMAALFLCAVCAPAFSEDKGLPGAENWGKAYEAAKKAQIENPDAGKCPQSVNGLDGIAAQKSFDGYRDSFQTDISAKKDAERINITSGTGSETKELTFGQSK